MPVPRGLRLPSLDGGGIRGLSELLLLKEMMERLRAHKGLDSVPHPCDVFDMMAGSGTGGIIALLLGRLRMSVDDAIQAYLTLSSKALSGTKWFETQNYRTSKLEEVLREIICMRTGNGDYRMVSARSKCKVFVCAMSAHTLSPGIPRLLRSYETESHEDNDYTICQAGRATTAYPLSFKPVKIGRPGIAEPFVDGTFGCNNPLDILLEEAFRAFPNRQVSCIVSLGAGHSGPASLLAQDVTELLIKIASDCEETANEAELRFKDLPGVYFRFNVSRSLALVENEDWNYAATIMAHTSSYVSTDEVTQRMENAVKEMSKREVGKISTRQLRRFQRISYDARSISSSSVDRSSVRQSFPRTLVADGSSRTTASDTLLRLAAATKNKSLQGLIRARKHTRALALLQQGLNAEAESILRDVLRARHQFRDAGDERTVSAQSDLALSVSRQGRHSEAEAIYKKMLSSDEEALGKERIAMVRHNLAIEITAQSRYMEAETIFREVLSERKRILGHGHEDTLRTQHKLADNVARQKRYVEAEGIYREVLVVGRRVLGEEHEETLLTRHELAQTFSDQGRHAKADTMFREVLVARKRTLGENHEDTLSTEYHMILNASKEGFHAEPMKIGREVLEDSEREDAYRENHMAASTFIQVYDITQSTNTDALMVQREEHGGEAGTAAIPRVVTSLAVQTPELTQGLSPKVEGTPTPEPETPKEARMILGDESNLMSIVEDTPVIQLGEPHEYVYALSVDAAQLNATRLPKAREGYFEVTDPGYLSRDILDWVRNMGTKAMAKVGGRATWRMITGEEHRHMLALEELYSRKFSTQQSLAYHLSLQRNYAEAERIYREVLAARTRLSGAEHKEVMVVQQNLACSISEQGRYSEAEEIYRYVFSSSKKVLGETHEDTLWIGNNLAWSILQQGRLEEAEDMYRTVLGAREKVLGGEHADTLSTQHDLAYCISQQGLDRYVEATDMFKEVLAARRRLLGEDHGDTLCTERRLGKLLGQ